MTFVPFDASDDEIAQRSIVRAGVPEEMTAPLRGWITRSLKKSSWVVTSVDYANLDLVHDIQTALWLDLGAPHSGDIELQRTVAAIYSRGEQVVIRVVDYLASRSDPSDVLILRRMLDQSLSKYAVRTSGDVSRLALRTPEGVEQTVQSAIDSSDVAGGLLARAWTYAFGLDAKPAEAMDFAVKAVERATTPVVSPRNDVATLGTAARDVKNQGDWTHGMRVNDLAPANTTIHHMMQTLWYGQQYRHVNKNSTPPTVEQAQTHVMLAATLVGWFSSGAVVRGD
ncbi:hypothetical protein GCM10027403_14760 [Arthrobacter tecti]